MESRSNFLTRGIFFAAEAARLCIPETPTTEGVDICLELVPAATNINSGSHVEISGHFMKDTNGFRLVVDSIRALDPGETIHRPDFVLPKK